jgi:hypothetical protein
MRKIVMYVLIAVSAVIIIAVAILLSNPLRRSEESIRSNMLKLTPIGTSMEDVINVIENNKNWKIRYTFDNGYSMLGGRPSGPYYGDDGTIVGVKSIDAHIGEYRTIFATDVLIFYAFDENLKLINIAVRKDTDSL